jgi:hypothetical protein
MSARPRIRGEEDRRVRVHLALRSVVCREEVRVLMYKSVIFVQHT